MKRLRKVKLIILVFTLTILSVNMKPIDVIRPVTLELAEKTATYYAERKWGKAEMFSSSTYYDPDVSPVIYVFTFYRKGGLLPAREKIITEINSARMERLAAEELLKTQEDHFLRDFIEEMWQEMRHEEEFGTVIVGAHNVLPPVLMRYDGLPFEMVALEDAKEIAQGALGTDKVVLLELYYLHPFTFFFEFEGNGETILVNPNPPYQTMTWEEIEGWWNPDESYPADLRKENQEKWLGMEEKFLKQFVWVDAAQIYQNKITGVPDYTWYLGCTPTAAANVLGYWDTKGYDRLVDGTDYSSLISELAKAMGTDKSGKTSVENCDDGIEKVSNDDLYGNNYGFDALNDSSHSWYAFKGEIDGGRPILYHVFSHPAYGNHSMTGIGWKEENQQKWAIVHDTWPTTPADVETSWSESASNCLYTKVTPGGLFSVKLTAQPSAGTAPLTVSLKAAVSGTTTGTSNYSFWWNCNDSGTSVSNAVSLCGNPWDSNYGIKFDGVSSTSMTVTHVYPSPGVYTAKVIAEHRDFAVEQRITITVNSGPLPDLTSSAQVTSSYKSGQKGVQIPVKVMRSGGTLTKGAHVHAKLYWSTNSTWDAGDTVLWSSNDSTPDFPNSTLNTVGYKTVSATVNIPDVSSGKYYLISYADAPTPSYPSGYHPESNESNNTTVYVVSVSVSTPTLRIDGGTSSSKPQNNTYYFTGSSYTPNRTVTRYLRQPDGRQIVLTPTLTADGGGNISWSFTSSCSTTTGTYNLCAVDDATGRVSNQVSEIVTANASCTSLRITSISPSTVTKNQWATFTLTGSGFQGSFTAQLINELGYVYPVSSTQYISSTSVKVTVFLGSGPTSTQWIKIINPNGQSAQISFTALAG